MKNIIGLIICLGLASAAMSCFDETHVPKKGVVAFGANYDVIDCITIVTVFLDGESIGTLESPLDAISDCHENGTITKRISTGKHNYRIEIHSPNGSGCMKNISGTFEIAENECKKIFIDYYKIFAGENCDQNVIIDETEYANAPDNFLSITDMFISGNCLKIRFNASGCSGDSWIVKLIDSGMIAESLPCQRTLRLSLDNSEACDAVIEKEISFNIEDLQIAGNNSVYLNVLGYGGILYEY